MRLKEALFSVDWILTGAAVLLVSLSLAMLFSAASSDALLSPRFIQQALSFGIALSLYMVVSAFPYHLLRRHAPLIYGLSLVSLLIVSQLGRIIRGTTSRIDLFGIQVQPSEFMKVAIVIALAWIFAKWGSSNWTTLITSGLLVAIAATLIALEPDIGVAALIITLWVAMLIFLGISWRIVALLGMLSAMSFWASWNWLFAAYQKTRILTYLDPSNDPLGAGYNLVQSIVALGSGGLFGRGLGHGPQSQLKFLPEQHTDFILASIGEELGFIGILLITVLYIILLWRILLVARSTQDTFGQYLAVGVFLLLLVSFFVSAGMNMGLLPVTGIPLPLISYGGSNLVSTLLLLAIVQSVHIYSKWVRSPPAEIFHVT